MYPTGLSRPYMLRVSSRTWLRDSHDLFDYETHQHVKISHFATSCPLKVLRNDSEVSVIDYNNNVDREHDHLLSIVCNRAGDYIVAPAEKIQGSLLSPQKLWLIVRTLPSQRYPLQENDIIKLGRFRLRVKQLVPGPSVETPDSSSDNTIGYPDDVINCGETNDAQIVKLFDGIIPDKTITFEEQCNIQCRICLSEGYLHYPSSDNTPNTTPANSSSNDTSLDIDSVTGKMDIYSNPLNSNTSSVTCSLDPNLADASIDNLEKSATFESDRLICACECKGSIKYVHVECLRKWIDSKWSLRGEDPLPSIVFIKEVSCELCKTNYPCFIRQNGELIQIVKMPKMQTPFLVLENTTPQAVRGVHLVSMRDSKDLKLGRGHESDLRIPDVSISRYHANIRYENGQFYLEDHDSKFGTLVAMKKSRIVSSDEPLAVQVGRSVINLTVDKSLPYFEKTWLTLTPTPPVYNTFDVPTNGSGNVDLNLNSAPVFGSQAYNSMIPTVNVPNMGNGNNMSNQGNMGNQVNMTNPGAFGNPVNVANLTSSSNGVNVMHSQGISPNSTAIGIDMMDHPMHPSGYMSFYQPSYSNPVHIPSPSNSNSISNGSNNFAFQQGSSTPTAPTNGNGGNVGPAHTLPSSGHGLPSPGHGLPSPGSRVSPLNDIYWGCLREAARQRFDPHALDGLANNRLNSFRLNPVSSSPNMNNGNGNLSMNSSGVISSSSSSGMSSSGQMNPGNSSSSGMSMSNSGEDLDMLLPDTVFIANWNNLPTRNLDLNGDTSTSALEHRHSQDLDKPITRI